MIENAKAIATKAWSMWGLYLIGAFSLLDNILPLVSDYQPWSPTIFSKVVGVVAAVTALLRVIPQPELAKDAGQ